MATDIPATTAGETIIPNETSPFRATSHHALVQRTIPGIAPKVETATEIKIKRNVEATATTATEKTKIKEKETKIKRIQRSKERTIS
jgi:hypothetical protein